MEKNTLLLLFALSLYAINGSAQATFPAHDSVDINNITARILVHGDMFWDPVEEVASTQFPAHSGKSVNFTSALWMSGYDAGGALHVAAQTYRQTGNDYWPGPLDGSDTLTYATSHDWAKIWKVNKTDIATFLALTTHTTTNTPPMILTWPGKGNTYAAGNASAVLTVTTDMAPFVDLNSNGIYEPLLGEYPAIKGDQALWWTFSDNGPAHTQTNGKPLGVEVHAMAYGISRGTLMDDVVYFDYTVVNKSANDYHDFRLALFDDADLGWYFDDFIGFDSVHRMGIDYNGTNDDGAGGGHPHNSYGVDPPQMGMTFIVLPGDEPGAYVPLGNFDYYNNDASTIGNPNTDTQVNNYMRGMIRTGQHFSDDFQGAGIPSTGYDSGRIVNYVFPGDPSDPTQWSECVSNNNPGDRRFILSSNDFPLAAGTSQHIVLAMVVADSVGGCPDASFTKIKIVADTAWAEYHSEVAVGVPNTVQTGAMNIYPNPAHDQLIIGTSSQSAGDATITIYNFIGQAMNVPIIKGSKGYAADVSKLPPGVYNLLYMQDGNVKTSNFIKQ